MNVKKIVFFALFALVISSSLFAKKAGNAPKSGGIPLTADMLQGGVWEVLNIDGDAYPMSKDGILMHMYFIFSTDSNIYLGGKLEGGGESVLANGGKYVQYKLQGNVITIADDKFSYSIDKEGKMVLTDQEGSKMLLQAVDSPTIEEIKKAEPMDFGGSL